MFSFGKSSVAKPSSAGNRRSWSTKLRDDQITSLLSENATIREVKPGEYNLGLQLPDKKIIALRVALSESFPTVAPVLQIMTHATHPWLSTDGYCRVIGHPELAQWNPHCNLGKVVKEVVSEFCTHPPKPVTSIPPADTHEREAPSRRNEAMPAGLDEQTDVPMNLLADLSALTELGSLNSELSNLSKEQRDIVIDSGDAMCIFLGRLKCIDLWNSVVEEQLEANEILAANNLKYEEVISELSLEISNLQFALQAEERDFKEHLLRHQAIGKKFLPEHIYKEVGNSCRKLETGCEEIVSQFHESELDVETFGEAFLEKRLKYHRLVILADGFARANGLALS